MYASFNARALGLSLAAGRTIQLAAEAGFAGVDLLVRDLVADRADPVALRARMEELGLRGGAWPLPVRWRGDEATYRADLRELPALAAAAATLGLTRTGTWVLPETPAGPRSDLPAGDDGPAVAAFHAQRLGPVARILADHGSALGLEVIGVESARTGRGRPFVTRLAELAPRLGRLLDEHPNVGILLDAFHLHAAGEGLEAGLAWGVGRIAWVHVADLPRGAPAARDRIRDGDRGLPGETGRVDVAGLLARLAAEGYDGPVTVETLAGCRALAGLDAGQVAQAAAGALRRAWPGPDLAHG